MCHCNHLFYSSHLSGPYWIGTKRSFSEVQSSRERESDHSLPCKLRCTPPSFISWTKTVLTLHCNYFDLRTPSFDCSTLDCQQNISHYTTISFLHTHSPSHSQPESSISPSKNNSQRRSTEASSRRSLLSKCQTVPQFTSECNLILTHNCTAFSLRAQNSQLLNNIMCRPVMPNFTPNRSVNLGNVGRVDRH